MLNIYNTAQLNFELLKEIGQEGDNSEVFLAHDKQLDGNIVIKRIRKKAFLDKDAFFRESKVLFNSSHDNVVQVKYGCEDEDYIYIAMPYYERSSMNKLINDRYLTVREIIRYSLQFLSGLNHIHSKGLVHFDVKPDNILISDSDEAMVSDFGLAKYTDKYGVARQERIYQKQTPPERFDTDRFSITFDIYQAGVAIYRMCNGNLAFHQQFDSIKDWNGQFEWNIFKRKIKNGQFPDRKTYHLRIPAKLRKIVNKAMEADPDNRFRTVLDFTNELSKVDKILDWQFCQDGNKHIYERAMDNKIIRMSISRSNGLSRCETVKIMKNTGSMTKVSKFCKSSVTELELDNLIEKCLNEYGGAD